MSRIKITLTKSLVDVQFQHISLAHNWTSKVWTNIRLN